MENRETRCCFRRPAPVGNKAILRQILEAQDRQNGFCVRSDCHRRSPREMMIALGFVRKIIPSLRDRRMREGD